MDDTPEYVEQTRSQRADALLGTESTKGLPALLLFLWVGSGALRRVRGRSSQVKGACGVAARVRFAPP